MITAAFPSLGFPSHVCPVTVAPKSGKEFMSTLFPKTEDMHLVLINNESSNIPAVEGLSPRPQSRAIAKRVHALNLDPTNTPSLTPMKPSQNRTPRSSISRNCMRTLSFSNERSAIANDSPIVDGGDVGAALSSRPLIGKSANSVNSLDIDLSAHNSARSSRRSSLDKDMLAGRSRSPSPSPPSHDELLEFLNQRVLIEDSESEDDGDDEDSDGDFHDSIEGRPVTAHALASLCAVSVASAAHPPPEVHDDVDHRLPYTVCEEIDKDHVPDAVQAYRIASQGIDNRPLSPADELLAIAMERQQASRQSMRSSYGSRPNSRAMAIKRPESRCAESEGDLKGRKLRVQLHLPTLSPLA